MELPTTLSQGRVQTDNNEAGMQPVPLLLVHVLILMGSL